MYIKPLSSLPPEILLSDKTFFLRFDTEIHHTTGLYIYPKEDFHSIYLLFNFIQSTVCPKNSFSKNGRINVYELSNMKRA